MHHLLLFLSRSGLPLNESFRSVEVREYLLSDTAYFGRPQVAYIIKVLLVILFFIYLFAGIHPALSNI